MKSKAAVAVFLGFILSIFSFAQEKFVALTFDDGPNPVFLKKALPYFRDQKIKVTFFIIGAEAVNYPKLIALESNNGHEIENHTYGHVCLVKPNSKWNLCKNISIDKAVWQIEQTNKIVFDITGQRPMFLRPPFFAMTQERKSELQKITGITILNHGSDSVGSLDWIYNSPMPIVSNVKKIIKERNFNSCIIVFHERLNTLLALPDIINFLRNNKYIFVRLDEFEKEERGRK